MKSIALLLALSSTSAFSAEYIVKFDSQKALKSFTDVKVMNVSVGNFAVVRSEDKNFLARANKLNGIVYAEPNVTYYSSAQDADFKKQWGLDNDGKNSGGWFSRGTPGVDVRALEAWKVTKGSKAVKIAVIDTGVDYRHEDLKNNIMINEAELKGQAGVDDDGNGYIDDTYGYDFANNDNDPMDGHGHGTHCAGVIGAEHNRIGIAGVMANVQILPIKFLTDSGSGTLEGAIASIDYAIKRGVNIMSNSWGGGPRTEALLEVIQKAEQAGILFVAASGNSNADNDATPSYPASYETENMVAVGAIDGKGNRANFSNYGARSVHVFAPGVDTYSTVQGNKYKKMSGTSMACPHVSGVAGLLLSQRPDLSVTEIRQLLIDSATNNDGLRGRGVSGYVNAAKALQQ
ncbi:MAG: S8 family peptidase [Bacteriovoracia bacterium]